MEKLEYYGLVDRSLWVQEGPWEHEPDKVQWPDEETGLPCLAVRGSIGGWCGYVGVSPGHPCYGKGYDDDSCRSLNVHGGLTFAAGCQGDPEGYSVCHKAGPDEEDNVWWLGFDCLYIGDQYPTRRRYPDSPIKGFPETYKVLGYVQNECRELAKQLKALENAD